MIRLLLSLSIISLFFHNCTKTEQLPLPISDSIRIGLVAHYPMNGSPRDSTGNNPDLELFNITTQLSARGNNFGESSYYFAGNTNSFMKLRLNNFRAIRGALFISFFAKETGSGTDSPRLFEIWPGNYGAGFYWFNWYQGTIKWAGPDFELIADTTVMNRNRWYHLAVLHDIYSIKLYRDGKLIARQNLVGNTPPAAIQLQNYMEIGRMAQVKASAYQGSMLDFRIYNRALSDREIEYLANQ